MQDLMLMKTHLKWIMQMKLIEDVHKQLVFPLAEQCYTSPLSIGAFIPESIAPVIPRKIILILLNL